LARKFENDESNISVELSIEIEACINKLKKSFLLGKTSTVDYLKKRKAILKLVEQSKELVVEWRKEIEV
jgi:hypothetical protein